MQKMLLVGMAFCAILTPAYAQTSWTNPAGGSFTTATNWSAGQPTATVDAQVLIATSSPITIPSNVATKDFTLNNAGATVTNNSFQTMTTNGLFTLSAGTFTQNNSDLNLNAGMVMNGGSFTQTGAIPNTNLTGTMTLNGGVFNLNGGNLNGGTVTGGGNRLKAVSGTLNGVFVDLNTADFTNSGATLTGGTTFATNSTYNVNGNIFFDQANVSNVAWVVSNSDNFYSRLPNASWTIGSSGSSSPAVSFSGTLQFGLSTAGSNAGNSLINAGIIENSGTGTIVISVSGDFTNNSAATLRTTNGRIDISNALSATNDGTIVTNGGTINATPIGGNFTNNGTITANTGTVKIAPTGNAINTSTITAVGGTVTVDPTGTFSNTGTITIQSSGTLRVQSSVTPADLGTISRATPNTGLFYLDGGTLTLPANTDIANLGTITMANSATISGGAFTLSTTNAAQIKFQPFTNAGTINNVKLGVGVLSFANSNELVTFSGNTTFAPGSAYTLNTSPSLFFSQPSFSDVAFTLTNGGILWANQANSTLTINSSGSSAPAVLSTGGQGFGGGISSSAANASIVNNAILESNGNGGLGINPSGDVTNNGTMRATVGTLNISNAGNFINYGILIATGGAIYVQPGGSFTTSPGSQITATGSGFIQLPRSSVTNGAIVNITNGTLNVNETGTATYTNIAAGTTTVLSGSTANIGNNSSSSIVNNGILSVGTSATPGGTVNVGAASSLGIVTNTNGLINLNGTLNSRVTIHSGTLTGSGTINALTTTSVIIESTGRLAPGNSPGQIVIGGGLDVGGTLELDIASGGGNNSNTTGSMTPGSGFDTITVRPPSGSSTATDAIVRIASTTFRLKSGNTSQEQFNTDGFWNATQRWAFLRTSSTNPGAIKLLDANGQQVSTVNNLVGASVRVFDKDGITEFNPYESHANGVFFYSLTSSSDPLYTSQLDLVWSPVPVPEPATIFAIAACGLGLAGFGKRLRQNRQQSIVNPV